MRSELLKESPARTEDLERSTRPDSGASGTRAYRGARPYLKEKPVDQAGMLKVPDGPGLGVTVNEAALTGGRDPRGGRHPNRAVQYCRAF